MSKLSEPVFQYGSDIGRNWPELGLNVELHFLRIRICVLLRNKLCKTTSFSCGKNCITLKLRCIKHILTETLCTVRTDKG